MRMILNPFKLLKIGKKPTTPLKETGNSQESRTINQETWTIGESRRIESSNPC